MARSSLPLAAAVVALALAAPAQAAQEQITGQLSKRGYTLIMLGKNAKSKTFRGPGKFELKPPAGISTLHLRGPDGSYAGPVVAARISKTKLVMGFKPGADLGKLKLKKGFATTGRRVDDKYLAKARTAKARKGKPIGAGNFGRVKTRGGGRSAQTGADAGAGADPDGDGVPNAFDADNDGDLNLDNTDSSGGGGRNCASPPGPQDDPACLTEVGFWTFSQFLLGVPKTVNANGGATRAQIDATMSGANSGSGADYNAGVSLIMQVPSADGVELDCGGLGYCSKGGTGQVEIFNGPNAGVHAFPGDFDNDGDGFGNMLSAGRDGPGGREFTLLPHAKSAQIGPGDTFIERLTNGGTEVQVPGSIAYVFNTNPALVQWTDGTNSGTISYPPPANPPGTVDNPLLVEPNAGGKIVFTMTLWRPQRAAFPNEPNGFVDIGRLTYTVSSPSLPEASFGPGGTQERLGTCNKTLVDTQGDAPADPSRRLTFEIDLTECLGGKNEEGVVDTWDSGELFDLTLQARTRVGDNGGQRIFLKRK